MARYDTVENIVAKAASELGLGAVTVSYDSPDENVLRLLELLNSTCMDLVLENEWLQLRREHTFSTTINTVYELPSDFLTMVDGTGWNRTARRPLRPVGDQEWQALQAGSVAPFSMIACRVGVERDGNEYSTLEFPEALTTGQTVALEYRSRSWARTAPIGSAVFSDVATATTQVVLVDNHLVKRALKLAFKRSKGFDSSAEQQDFDRAMASVRGSNVAVAPSLFLGGGRRGGHCADEYTVPASGYSSSLDAGGLY